MNLTLEMKQILEVYCETGKSIYCLAYDPSSVIGNPEADAIASGLIEYHKDSSAKLIEVVYLPTVLGALGAIWDDGTQEWDNGIIVWIN